MSTEEGIFTIVFGLLAVLTLYGLWKICKADAAPSQVTIPAKTPRSWAASQLKLEFNGLPPEHRPSVDIDAITYALDTKYGIDDVSRHFRYNNGSIDALAWTNHPCLTRSCPYQEYTDLHDQMVVLRKAYDAKEHALAIAEQEHGFRQMREMQEALKNEALSLVDTTHKIQEGNVHANQP